jgi:uncharacterized phage protein gp47/JayE
MPTLPSFGPNGLNVPRTADVRENIVEALENSPAWGTGVQVGADTALGQLVDIPAEQIGLVYELLQTLYDAWDVGAAPGLFLDNLIQLLGLFRDGATFSRVVVDITGTPNTTIPTGGRRIRVQDGPYFIVEQNIDTDGAGNGFGNALSLESGEVSAQAGTIDTIVDTHPDWSTVINPLDAIEGEPIETDTDLRNRRFADLTRAGRSTDRALRAALNQIQGVTSAAVISNRELATDPDGVPGKAFESIVYPDSGFDVDEIAKAIWVHSPNGIKSHGTDVAALVTDSQGETQTVRWTYAVDIDIYWEIDVTKAADGYPSNGDDLVADAVLRYGESLNVGDNVLPVGAIDAIIPGEGDTTEGVPGIAELVVRVQRLAPPGPADTGQVSISIREASAHALARIDVNS